MSKPDIVIWILDFLSADSANALPGTRIHSTLVNSPNGGLAKWVRIETTVVNRGIVEYVQRICLIWKRRRKGSEFVRGFNDLATYRTPGLVFDNDRHF